MRVRARRRNARAAMVSAGLIGFASVCLLLFVTGFASVGASRATGDRPAAPRTTVTHAPTTTVAPATTTSSSSTTVPPTTTTSTSTTTTTVPPTTTSTITSTTTTTLPRVTASASVSDEPSFCTVTVRLSTGAFRPYQLSSYIQNTGDQYGFPASLGGYRVDVRVRVTGKAGARHCVASVS